MNRSIEITHDRKAFLSINRRLWWQKSSMVFQYGLSPLWIGTVIAVMFYGKGSALGWFACVMSVAILLQPIASYLLNMQLVKRRFERNAGPMVTYALTDDLLIISDEIGRVELFWRGLNSILKFDQAWILGFPKGLEIIFPVQALDEETKRFLESKLQDAIIAHKAKPKVISPINN